MPVRPCVDRRIALELAGTACVVECAQVEVRRDALLGDVLVRVRVRVRGRVRVRVRVSSVTSSAVMVRSTAPRSATALTKKPASLRMMRLRMAGLPRMVLG